MPDISRLLFAKQIDHMELRGPQRSLCVETTGFKGETWASGKGKVLGAQGHTRR